MEIVDISKLYSSIVKLQRSKNESLRNKYFKRILKVFKGDIYYIASKYARYSFLDFDDLQQELSLLLYDIVSSYKIKNKNKFQKIRAYILTAFHNEMYATLLSYKRQRRIPPNKMVSLDSAVESNDGTQMILYDIIPDHSDLFKQISDRNFITVLKKRINKKYWFIIDRMLLGKYTYKELSEGVKINNKDVSLKNIYQIIKRRIIPEAVKLLVE